MSINLHIVFGVTKTRDRRHVLHMARPYST